MHSVVFSEAVFPSMEAFGKRVDISDERVNSSFATRFMVHLSTKIGDHEVILKLNRTSTPALVTKFRCMVTAKRRLSILTVVSFLDEDNFNN